MRVAIGIEYDGTAYNGWQRQDTGTGVQTPVEQAVSSVANEAVELVCAGRTDAGVHASGQVAHFDTGAERSRRNWLLGINSELPADINASWVSFVDDDFHARFSATSRSYRYLILNRAVRSALHRNRAWWIFEPLDEQAMLDAAGCLVGEHDFSAFRAAGCQASTPVRTIEQLDIVREGEWLRIEVSANAFLQHMVRNITGVLVAIGKGEQPSSWAKDVLLSRDRKQGGVAAPAHGLTLIAVNYPEKYKLPCSAHAEFRL
ncbi:MAG: tRNA pseudouridine(38-40) synthase TruA [Woeseiaceae bacterium]|nr:tRNA pseudouridine(38-40) synthase TruA [Woeseiaceae bacterium]